MDSSIHDNSLGIRNAKTRILTDEEIVNVKYAVGVVPVKNSKNDAAANQSKSDC